MKNQNIKEKYRYSSDWINKLESKQHWSYYWCQQKIMEGIIKKGDRILEIGVGSGFTANYLRSKGYDVTTLDIDKEKNPDLNVNIVEYEFTNSFDHVIAFEILEHIPFEEFCQVIEKVRSIVQGYFFVSLPRNELVILNIEVKVPLLPRTAFRLPVKRRKVVTPNHHWELDFGQFNMKYVMEKFTSAGFQVTKSFKENNIYFYAFR